MKQGGGSTLCGGLLKPISILIDTMAVRKYLLLMEFLKMRMVVTHSGLGLEVRI
jgi:hypothetical protein